VPKLDHRELLTFCRRLLVTGGVPREDADLVAGLLVKAELRGYAGHGVSRVSQYLSFIKNKTYDLSARPQVEREGKVTAVIDGKHYIGQVAAHMAMTLAINKAKEHGAGIVCLRRSGHTGRLADYMEMATEQGMIGMGAVSVGSATTTLYGGMKPITGTNPMAFGIPTRNRQPIILDFATASMSMGEIQKRVARKEAIPDGVILDGHGVNGVFLQAICVEEFQPVAKFYDKVDELIAFASSTKCAPGFSEILMPGESGRRKEAMHRENGVEINGDTRSELTALAAGLGVHEVPATL